MVTSRITLVKIFFIIPEIAIMRLNKPAKLYEWYERSLTLMPPGGTNRSYGTMGIMGAFFLLPIRCSYGTLIVLKFDVSRIVLWVYP